MAMTELAVCKSVTVETTVDRAFQVFTDRIDAWWIREHHIGTAELDRVVLEPRAGGRWYEIGKDGSPDFQHLFGLRYDQIVLGLVGTVLDGNVVTTTSKGPGGKSFRGDSDVPRRYPFRHNGPSTLRQRIFFY